LIALSETALSVQGHFGFRLQSRYRCGSFSKKRIETRTRRLRIARCTALNADPMSVQFAMLLERKLVMPVH
jgi:hypothetical protein